MDKSQLEQKVSPSHDFVPFREIAPSDGREYLYVEGCHEKPQRVVLQELPVGTLLLVCGSCSPASYLMKVLEGDGKKKVAMWKDFRSDGLIGPIDAISSTSPGPWIAKDRKTENGVMELGKQFSFPYFTYHGIKILQPE